MTEDYHPPVSQLLALGDAWRKERPDYLTEFGFTEADLPELRRLLFDERFYNDDESPAGWGYIHAMYVLGELRTEEALQTLIEAATRLTEHDGLWATIPEPL